MHHAELSRINNDLRLKVVAEMSARSDYNYAQRAAGDLATLRFGNPDLVPEDDDLTLEGEAAEVYQRVASHRLRHTHEAAPVAGEESPRRASVMEAPLNRGRAKAAAEAEPAPHSEEKP